MLENSLQILNKLVDHGFKAYITGGFVRDYLLGINSNDIDIATNATPKEIKEIFVDACLPVEDYGAVTITHQGRKVEITTFRKESSYVDHRRPVEVKYIDDLYTDLERRDFTINAICMNKDKEILDFVKGKKDIDDRLIRTIGNADDKFNQDALRILRAVRFSTTLNFQFTDEVSDAIKNNKQYLKDISYLRKRQELDKIFSSSNSQKGITLLLSLGLDKVLELKDLDKIKETDSLLGIWAMLDVMDIYPFTKNEKDLMQKIRQVHDLNMFDPVVLYRYGLYVCTEVATMKKTSKKDLTEKYNQLPIKSRSDIDVETEDILRTLKKEAGAYLSTVYEGVEEAILNGKLNNDKNQILTFIKEKYI